jgi:hypothetical protein
MKGKIIATLIFISFLSKTKAQESNVKISNIMMYASKKYFRPIRQAKPDTLIHDTMNVRLMFSCSSPSSTDTLIIKIGTNKNDGTFFFKKFPIVSQGNNLFGFNSSGIYYLPSNTASTDNVFNPFTGGNMIGFNLIVNEAMYKTMKWITVYAIDKQKKISNYEYYQVN